MVLKLYGLHASHFVRLVAAVLIEKKVPFEFVKVELSKGEQKTPEFLAKHPFGQVPLIVCHSFLNCLTAFLTYNYSIFLLRWLGQDDDGFIVYETRAICFYIASKYPNQGTPLLPTGLKVTTLYQQAVFVEASHINAHAEQATQEMIYKRWAINCVRYAYVRWLIWPFFVFLPKDTETRLPTKRPLTSTLLIWVSNWKCTTRFWVNRSIS